MACVKDAIVKGSEEYEKWAFADFDRMAQEEDPNWAWLEERELTRLPAWPEADRAKLQSAARDYWKDKMYELGDDAISYYEQRLPVLEGKVKVN